MACCSVRRRKGVVAGEEDSAVTQAVRVTPWVAFGHFGTVGRNGEWAIPRKPGRLGWNREVLGFDRETDRRGIAGSMVP